jgi:hypothetical protein
VCGGRVLDMEALQGATHYDDGYTAAHPVVQWFWEVRHMQASRQAGTIASGMSWIALKQAVSTGAASSRAASWEKACTRLRPAGRTRMGRGHGTMYVHKPVVS